MILKECRTLQHACLTHTSFTGQASSYALILIFITCNFTVVSLEVDCVYFQNIRLWVPIFTSLCHQVVYLTCTKVMFLLARVWACVVSNLMQEITSPFILHMYVKSK